MKKIKYKQYRLYKLLIVMLLAAIVSASVTVGNFVIPLVVFLLAIILMFILKKNVDEHLINNLAGRASRIVFTVSTIIMALGGMVLIALRENYPQYLIVGYVLSYFACAMMFLYGILFKYYSKKA